jgi:hypothetical protein
MDTDGFEVVVGSRVHEHHMAILVCFAINKAEPYVGLLPKHGLGTRAMTTRRSGFRKESPALLMLSERILMGLKSSSAVGYTSITWRYLCVLRSTKLSRTLGDDNTKKWVPQGITSSADAFGKGTWNDHEAWIVSW